MLNLILVIIGIIIFGYSLYLHVRFLGSVRKTPLRKWWVVLLALVLFFALGYIVFAYWLVAGTEVININFLKTLISLIFFFGAIFVVTTISLISLTTGDLIRERGGLEKKVKERTAELEQFKSDLEEYTKKLEKTVEERTSESQSKVKELNEARLILLSLAEDIQKEKEAVEQKVLERTRELKEEQARFLASIYSLPLGFILAGKDHVLLLKNDSVNIYLGLPPGDFSMSAVMRVLEGSVDVKSKAEECMAKRSTVVSDIEYGDKFLKLFFAPIMMLHDSNEMIGYVILFEDVTEAKLLERTRDEFFAIASHELRTPLTAIRGNTELIQDFFAEEVKNKEVLSMIADIQNASTRLIALVNDFLDVSRIEQHKIKFKNEAVSLAAIAKEVVNTFATAMADKKLSMHLKIPHSLPEAFGDSDHIKQVFINVVGNAVNYTKKGSVTITVAPEGNFLKTSVSDTGIGISEESKKLLFRKFQQAGKNIFTRDITRGTGLGLYISRLLVEDMKGTIWLEESKEGEGSTFSFTLPMAV